jgi:hypothetical protein
VPCVLSTVQVLPLESVTEDRSTLPPMRMTATILLPALGAVVIASAGVELFPEWEPLAMR